MFCISNVFKDHAVEYQTEEDPFEALKRDELLSGVGVVGDDQTIESPFVA